MADKKELYDNSVILYDESSRQWLYFHHPEKMYEAHSYNAVLSALHNIEHYLKHEGYYAAGFVAYEAAPAFDPAISVKSSTAFPLAWFCLYKKPDYISLPQACNPPVENPVWKPSINREEYTTSLHKIKEYILDGDTYQVNYSYRLYAPFSEDTLPFFVRMAQAQGTCYGAYIHTGDWTICSASPELFFKRDQGVLTSRPMKGTTRRGLWYAQDMQEAEWLYTSGKNRSENLMIVDMVRNDLGRIGEIGSVEVASLFDIEQYPTLWQMTSTVRCRTHAGITDILHALFPSASITGAPKVSTMKIIHELESTPRKIYCGTIGYCSPSGNLQFNVAIRTVLVDRRTNTAEYGVGGGILWDSMDDAEYEECAIKAQVLTRILPDFSLFETLLWTPEDGYVLLERHLKRLDESSRYFSRPLNHDLVHQKLADCEREMTPCPHRIRLVVSAEGNPVVESTNLSRAQQPYTMRLARNPVDSTDVFLYHKTTQRHVYEKALAESPGYNDVLLWNERKEITESCIANLVVEINGELLTPPLSSGLLAGTYRSFLLDEGKIREEIIHVDDLEKCTKFFLINSVRGMWEIVLDTNRIQ